MRLLSITLVLLLSIAICSPQIVIIAKKKSAVAATPWITSYTGGTFISSGTLVCANGMGTRFTVGATGITVYSLGRWRSSGNALSHTVKLVTTAGTDISGGSVSIDMSSGTVGAFKYVDLASPVSLSASTSYFIVSSEAEADDDYWDQNGSYTVTSAAAISNAVASCASLSGGAYVLYNATNGWGPVNFTYTLP